MNTLRSKDYEDAVNNLLSNEDPRHFAIIWQMTKDVIQAGLKVEGVDCLTYRDHYARLCELNGLKPQYAHIGLAKDACLEVEKMYRAIEEAIAVTELR